MATKLQTKPEAKEEEIVYTDATKFEAYTGDEPYLFVSYSHRDSTMVYSILDELYDQRYRLWYDESCETGNDFRDELRQRIKNSEAVLLFVSQASMTSPFCGMEIIVACEYGKRIFPIYLDEYEVPPAFSILLSSKHHGDVTNMSKLIKSLVRDLPAVAMDRLTKDGDELKKCEDNGDQIAVDEGIRLICAGAFKNRKALKRIDLPESLEVIEEESFRGCGKLEKMIIPKNTRKIGESAFRDCVSLKSLVIKNGCIKIGERAFENCANLTDIELPDNLAEIYNGVFNSCKSLKSIRLPASLTILGESAFSDCIELSSVEIPDTVAKIDDLVFNGCSKLSAIKLNDSLKKIGKCAFKNCRSLTKIEIPASVTSINDAPFRGCESMKSIRVDPKNKYYKSAPNKIDGNDHVLFNKNKSTLVAYPASSREVQYDIPDSVTLVSDWAFCDCKKLNRITIPDSVQEIGEAAFCNCILLDEVEIPDSVVHLDDCVFRGCSSLEKVIIPASVKDLGWGLFDGCKNDLVVYCEPESEIEKYCMKNGIQYMNVADLIKE